MRSIQPPRLFRDFFSFILAQGRRENKSAQRAKRGKCAKTGILALLCIWGMGIDRVLQVLLGTRNIRDTVMFPLMRPEP